MLCRRQKWRRLFLFVYTAAAFAGGSVGVMPRFALIRLALAGDARATFPQGKAYVKRKHMGIFLKSTYVFALYPKGTLLWNSILPWLP